MNAAQSSQQKPSIISIILAAGDSSRFEGNKLLAKLPCGNTPLLLAYKKYQQISEEGLIDDLFIVCNSNNYKQFYSLLPEAQFLINPGAESGMGSSIKFAIKSVSSKNHDACLISLADKPFIKQASIIRVIKQFKQNKIVVPIYGEKEGHPVLFPKDAFDALLGISDQLGAKSVIASRSVFKLSLDDPGIGFDIDTKLDLQRAIEQFYFSN